MVDKISMPGKELYFKSAFSVDCVVFGFDQDSLKILVLKRGALPYMDQWALPGDLVHPEENLNHAASRILTSLTSLDDVYLEQVKTFGAVGRHPAGRVITVAYYALIKTNNQHIKPASWAKEVEWKKIAEVGDLAFDHNKILNSCIERLRRKVRTHPLGFELLPKKFTLTELQYLYESILDEKLDKRNFRKKLLGMKLLVDLNELQEGVPHRPARLYSFDQEKYEQMQVAGFDFGL